MEKHPIRLDQVSGGEEVSLLEYCRKRKRFFAVFLICAALLVAAFAITYALGMEEWKGKDDGIYGAEGSVEETKEKTDSVFESVTGQESLLAEDTSRKSSTDGMGELDSTPHVGVPILAMTLPTYSDRSAYINNESIHTVNGADLLAYDVSHKVGEEPLVLILHTHTHEGYTENGAEWIRGDVGEVTYTEQSHKSVIAVGETLCDTLNGHGIGTIHCTTVHDADGSKGSYEKSAESIRFFRKLYPSISYVIDLHRDAILGADGEYIRAITADSETPAAQVMAVVGSDGNGTHHPNWKGNLALAEQLRKALNQEVKDLCRPSILRNASYNQELSTYALLLEIGTGANSVEEAKRSAVLVGNVLARLIRG